jgi:hypothetical protein
MTLCLQLSCTGTLRCAALRCDALRISRDAHPETRCCISCISRCRERCRRDAADLSCISREAHLSAEMQQCISRTLPRFANLSERCTVANLSERCTVANLERSAARLVASGKFDCKLNACLQFQFNIVLKQIKLI